MSEEETESVRIDAHTAAAIQLLVAALCIVVGIIGIGMDFTTGDRDVTRAGRIVAAGFIVAGVALAALGGINLVGRVVLDADGITVTSLGRNLGRPRIMAWEELVGIDFGRSPTVPGTTVVCRTENGDRVGSGVLRVRRRPNVFAFAAALDKFGYEDLAGERLRRYLDSSGLFA